jgi:hypothetical protein
MRLHGDHQQFGPPHANRMGSFFTEPIIAAPLAVARPSNTMMNVVIFTIFPPSVNAVQRTPFPDFLGAHLRGRVLISAVCGAPTTDGSILSVRSRRALLAAEHIGQEVSASAPTPGTTSTAGRALAFRPTPAGGGRPCAVGLASAVIAKLWFLFSNRIRLSSNGTSRMAGALVLFLPPLLLSSAFYTVWRDFRANLRIIVPRFLIPALRRRDPYPPISVPIIMSWAGMRGVVSLAAALALPDGFPGRDFIVATTFAVILVTVLLQGATLAPLIRALSFEGFHSMEARTCRRRMLVLEWLRLNWPRSTDAQRWTAKPIAIRDWLNNTGTVRERRRGIANRRVN